MENFMKFKLAPALLILGLLGSCAKEKSYEKIKKTADLQFASAHQDKNNMLSMCTKEDPCLYLPSVANTPYAISASRPFSQGDARLVVSHIINGKLQFLQLEEDERFDGNINNLSPVLNVEVEHIDYKCSEDEFGDCTNKEEVDTDKPWDKRKYLKIKDIDVVETNTLPIEFSEMFGSGCFTELDKRIEKLEVENGSMNVVVKKTYKANFRCSSVSTYDELMEQLRYMTFTVDHTYSIVKLSQLTDKSYRAIDYPSVDESHFGFFTTKIKKKTVDNHDTVMGVRKTLMNRWSPNKNEVTYYLNSEFYKPEMKSVLAVTKNSIETVNKSLEKANANLRIVLERGEDADIGDLRKNYIILVKDPQASGIIGYGPAVSNPKTGEIVNARTVMYYGSIKKYAGRAYDDLVDELIETLQTESAENAQVENTNVEAVSENADAATRSFEQMISKMSLRSDTKFVNYVTNTRDLDNLNRLDVFGTHSFNTLSMVKDNSFGATFAEDHAQAYAKLRKEVIEGKKGYEQWIAKLSEKNFYHGDMMNFDQAVIDALKEELANGGTLKYWDDLTEVERQKYLDKLLPYVWVSTLVHEFGHNLGLRHNFYGSTDTKNFYSEEEAHNHEMRKAPTYSSIMDYAPKANNELTVMGKYDVAALRFAYAREVETADGSFAKVPSTIKELEGVSLKSYKYCSDEHVSNNPLCNRHDEGQDYEGVLDYHITQYLKNYKKVNFRNRKYNFNSLNGDVDYYFRLVNIFSNVHQFFRVFDQSVANGDYDGEEWKTNERLVSLKKAADKSFVFFKDIIEQPGYHCIEIDGKTSTIKRIAPFAEMAKGSKLEEYGITFDIKMGCLLLNNYGREGMLYAEFGKYFNNSLDLLYDRSQIVEGDNSQIDVRGIWMDKVFATMFLGVRFTSPTTIGAASSGNYLDYPQYKNELLDSVDAILTNTKVKEVDITLPNGNIVKMALPYTFETDHKVNKSYNGGINYAFGLADSRTNAQNIMMNILKRELLDNRSEGDVQSEDALNSYHYFNVARVSPRVDLERFNYDKIVEFKSVGGEINYRFGVYSYNTKAMELAKLKEDLELLTLVKPQNIQLAQAVLTREEVTIEVIRGLEGITEDDISEIEVAMTVPDALNGLVSGTLNDQVVLSSLLALSK